MRPEAPGRGAAATTRRGSHPLPRPKSAAVGQGAAAGGQEPIISLQDVSVQYALRGSSLSRLFGRSTGAVHALDGVNLDLAPGEVVGLVGESGSGKSTLGRAILGLAPVTGGRIRYRGRDITGLSDSAMRPLRAKVQMIFQDPAAALNPSMTVGQGIADALRIHRVAKSERPARVVHALERVGLAPAERFAPKYPAELSGGQKQRAVIARALALGPELMVADEPISMLDMSVRAKILGLMADLRRDLGLSFIYITHDLASARFFCDRIAIMYLGRIVEIGPSAEIFANPRHPYTQALLAAVPEVATTAEADAPLPRGEIPDAARPPAGCPFHPRCPRAFAACGWEARDLRVVLDERWTHVSTEEYQAESAAVGDLDRTAAGYGRVLIPSRRPRELLTLLDDVRRQNPGEPFFSAVTGLEPQDGGVSVVLAAATPPELLPLKDSVVQVACHLYDR